MSCCETTCCDTSDAEQTPAASEFHPQVDIVELTDEFVVRADVPGAKADDINLHYEDGRLTIHAPVAARQDDETHYLRREYGVGDFRRTLSLGDQVDAENISAAAEDGVLTLHLPKLAGIKPRKIDVNTG